MENQCDVSVVLPCLNEADSVGACIDEVTANLQASGHTFEVIVVDNGSTDDSAGIASAHGARVVKEPVPGYGSALRSGIRSAIGDVVVMADADQTYPLDRTDELVKPVLADDADIVIGERLRDVAAGAMPFLHRYVGTPVLSFLVRRASHGVRVVDSQSGFRAFSRARVNELGLRSDGMEFASEMLIRAGRSGLRIRSIQTGYRPRVGDSKLNTLSDGWRHLQLILLMAPQLLLVWPGFALLATGVFLTGVSLAGTGVVIGSLRWQPTFFSGIAVVLGLQASLAGAVLANRSDVSGSEGRRMYDFVGRPSFPRRCTMLGALTALVGLAIDAALFVVNLGEQAHFSRGPALASLAQSLIIAGVSAGFFGVVQALLGRASLASVQSEG